MLLGRCWPCPAMAIKGHGLLQQELSRRAERDKGRELGSEAAGWSSRPRGHANGRVRREWSQGSLRSHVPSDPAGSRVPSLCATISSSSSAARAMEKPPTPLCLPGYRPLPAPADPRGPRSLPKSPGSSLTPWGRLQHKACSTAEQHLLLHHTISAAAQRLKPRRHFSRLFLSVPRQLLLP